MRTAHHGAVTWYTGEMASLGGGMRILIADDHDLLRDTLVMFLSSVGDMTVDGANSYAQALDLMEKVEPYDLLLLDYRMPGMNGLHWLKDALEHKRANHVALMSGDAPRAVIEEALNAGASGFVPKTLPAKSLRNAVAFMLMGKPICLPVSCRMSMAAPIQCCKI